MEDVIKMTMGGINETNEKEDNMFISNIRPGVETAHLYATLLDNVGKPLIVATLEFILLDVVKNNWTVSNFREALDRYTSTEEYRKHKEIHKRIEALTPYYRQKGARKTFTDATGKSFTINLDPIPEYIDDARLTIRGDHPGEYIEMRGKFILRGLSNLLVSFLEEDDINTMNDYIDIYPEHDHDPYEDPRPQQKIDEDGFLQFGEHEGEHIRTIPASYLEWILDEFDEADDRNTDLLEAIEEQLANRSFNKNYRAYDDSVC